MDYRQLGGSGFKVPVLSLGTGTFGGSSEFFKAWGTTGAKDATRLLDICLDAGLTMFNTADVYSSGLAEDILGQAIKDGVIRSSCRPRRHFAPARARTTSARRGIT